MAKLCLIIPMDEISGGPPGIWPGPHPSHPIMLPGMPGWGGQPPGGGYPDQGLPPFPSHPIAPGGPGAGYPPYPDQGLPPYPSHPIAPGGPGAGRPPGIWGPTDPRPTHPIYIPPTPGSPPGSPPIAVQLPVFPWTPQHPIELPPEGEGPHPEHPIVLPPEAPDGRPLEWKTAWTPQTGWIIVGVPAPGTEVPTPSRK